MTVITTSEQLRKDFDYMAKIALKVKADRDALLIGACLVLAGYDYNPGDSDLDDEQPIHVRMSLGDYRKLKRAVYRAEGGA